MGRFVLFIVVVAAALAGVWFYAPGGKDMLMGAKDKAMGYMPGDADDVAEDVVETTVETTEEVVEEVVDGVEDVADETAEAMDDDTAEETSDEPQL